MVGILILLVPAVAAPLLANGRPLLVFGKEGLRLPFLPFLFAPDSTEFLVEQFFNYVLLLLPLWLLIALIVRRQFPRRILCGAAALLLLLPFAAARPKLDKTDYRLAAGESGERPFSRRFRMDRSKLSPSPIRSPPGSTGSAPTRSAAMWPAA